MSSNLGKLGRDGIFGSLQIKSHIVLDHNANLDVAETKIKGNAKVKQNVIVLGNVFVKGAFC